MSHKHHRNVRWTTRTVYFYSAQKQLRFAALWSSFAPPFSYIAELDGEAFRTGWHDYEFWSALNSSKSVEERLALIAGLKITHFITDETDRFEMLPVIERLAEPIAKFDPITL